MPEFSATAWLIIGFGLIIAEIFTLTLVLLFFGIAAVLVAGIKLFGLNNLTYELILFAVLGIASILLFRQRICSSWSKNPGASMEIDHNKTFTLTAEIPAGGEASVQYQGTAWTAVNRGPAALSAGSQVKVVETDGVKLIVQSV